MINVQNLHQMRNFNNGNVCYARLYRIKEEDYTEPVRILLFSTAPNLYIPSVDPDAFAASASGATPRKRPHNDGIHCCLFLCLCLRVISFFTHLMA